MSNLLASFGQKKTPNDPPLRQGKWTREEEEYVHCLIDEFKTGMMPLAEGTSLRTFLSKMLNCHPMRISKKFVGSNYNGKQVYTRRTGSDRLSNEQVKARRAKLCELERKFLAKIAPNKPKPPTQYQQPPQPQFQMPGAGGLSSSGLGRVRTSGVDLRNLINQAALHHQADGVGAGAGGATSADLSRNISLLEMPLNDTGAGTSGSSHSLSNLFQELVNNNSTGSLDAFNLMMQQTATPALGGSNHFGNSKSNTNSRAAAAGRALLQSGLGLDKKPSATVSSVEAAPTSSAKPLSSFTSAELAAELRKRSSLKDLMAQLGGGGGAGAAGGGGGGGASSSADKNTSASQGSGSGSGSGSGLGPSSLATLQDSLQQAADVSSANAFSSLMRNSSIDMSNLIERQGSIDSLSNLAIRSRLQSIQSMGSLLDPLLDGGSFAAAGGSSTTNSNWTASSANPLNLNSLAAKVSSESMSSSQRRTAANDLMARFNSFGANSAGSGLNLASLLNNEDALRRLEASAPSSLHQNFSFAQPNKKPDSSSNSDSNRIRTTERAAAAAAAAAASTSDDDNTAIAQFLLQKKLLEQSNSSGSKLGGGDSESLKGKPSNSSEQQQLMMNVAAGGGGGGGHGSGGAMDPIMSSLLSSLKSSNDLSSSTGAGAFQQQQDDLETLKRKFFGGQDGLLDQQRRNKPFR